MSYMLEERIQLLMSALHLVLVADGVLRIDSAPTGPELLVAAAEYARFKNKQTQENMSLCDVVFATSDSIRNNRTSQDILGALVEEVGELSTEVNIQKGFSNKISGVDGIIGESIDVMLCALDMIRINHPECTDSELKEIAQAKCDKWVQGVTVQKNTLKGSWSFECGEMQTVIDERALNEVTNVLIDEINKQHR